MHMLRSLAFCASPFVHSPLPLSRSSPIHRHCRIHPFPISLTRQQQQQPIQPPATTPSLQAKPSQLPTHNRYAGGKGPLSTEFLCVTGALSTLIAIPALITLASTSSSLLPPASISRLLCLAFSSFSYGLLLARFDLRKAASLKLTIAFSLLMRFIFIPLLSHTVAIAGYALVALVHGTKAAAAAASAAAVVNAPATVRATAQSLSLPPGVLSSLFLLSTTPIGLSPSAAMLSLHVHTTLFAILTMLTLVLFPFLPSLSHIVSLWAHHSPFLNIGSILPQVASPPSVVVLFATTTAPVLLGLFTSRLLPQKYASIAALVALPCAWLASLLLLASATTQLIQGSAAGFAGSVGLCGGVVIMMALLGRAMGWALLLDERAKRTLILYLCTQGTVIGAGLAPATFSAAPAVASALVGFAFALIVGRAWRHVTIRTRKDVIL